MTQEQVDSRRETMKHIQKVMFALTDIVMALLNRANRHDQSKLEDPEVEVFDEFTPKLAGSTYGSTEYAALLKGMKPALDHHYAINRHHPEYHDGVIANMTLVDVVEMLCDWYAATKRHDDGDILKSIDINQKRFGFSDELAMIFRNTAEGMGWVDA